MIKILTMALLSAALAPVAALAQAQGDHAAHHATSATAAAMTEGEVRKVDKEQRKITLKHGPIANLDMPPMTMVFRAADPAMVDRVKAGDKVRFSAEKVGGEYTVTRIEPSK
jgi:Cu/Ag efflux protein CusF